MKKGSRLAPLFAYLDHNSAAIGVRRQSLLRLRMLLRRVVLAHLVMRALAALMMCAVV